MEPTIHTLLPPDDVARLRHAAGRACGLLKTLSNEDRLVILCQLAQGEANVGTLEAQLDIRQPTLSQQLGVLRDEGLVETRREGKFIYYRLANTPAVEVMQTLHRLYCASEESL
jgi:DNA-binding transcriptional ArsR family regulator